MERAAPRRGCGPFRVFADYRDGSRTAPVEASVAIRA
ncbi:hypothetical protein DFQ13_11251 [Actinokineospora spheciospongiae]|nr:hypothetical protein DFQ13_11251 [Actinokineospora spheciospongiae]